MGRHADHRYLEALRNNDSAAISELYSSVFPRISAWVRKNSGEEEDARDLFQEALVSLYHSAHKPGYELTCPVGGLIFAMCRNRWIDQIRKKSRESGVREAAADRYTPDEPTVSALEKQEEADLRKQLLDRTMRQLSPTCQELLKLLGQGINSSEAAKKLGMSSANTVYRRKNACINRWRELINGHKP